MNNFSFFSVRSALYCSWMRKNKTLSGKTVAITTVFPALQKTQQTTTRETP